MAPSLDDEEDIADERSSAPQLLVTAELDSGEAITGLFLVDLPPGHVRSLDYVNEARREFVALAQLDREYLINRSFIRFAIRGGRRDLILTARAVRAFEALPLSSSRFVNPRSSDDW